MEQMSFAGAEFAANSQALRGFLGIDPGRESVPDETTLLGFRHLLERHALTEQIFETVNAGLRAQGLMLAKVRPAQPRVSARHPQLTRTAPSGIALNWSVGRRPAQPALYQSTQQ